MKKLFFLALVLFGITNTTNAQILKDIIKAKDKITGITADKLSKGPITTSFRDVDKKRYIQDDFGNDQNFTNIFEQEFTPKKGFRLAPGFYEGSFQSFCVKAGTVAPNKGSGRFYSELKGPKKDIIETILAGLHNDRSITQREVQLLLWAIIAKTDFYKMKGPVKATALKILSAREISRLSKGALDGFARKKLNKLTYKSKALRAVIDAENNLRRTFYKGAKTYADYEDIAMIAGVEPVVSGWERGRWIKHPDGYFLRYYPSSYFKTRTQIYVPENAGTIFFNGRGDIGVPPGNGQRLLQTNLPYGNVGIVNSQPSQDEVNCNATPNTLVDAVVREQMIMQNIPGLTVAVFENGQITHINAYGYSNTFEKTPITKESVMHWASISKSVTAVAAMQLELDETIDYNINDLVTKYCDYWPPSVEYVATDEDETKGIDKRHAKIRIQHLLQNRSGINHYGDNTDSTKVGDLYVLYKNKSSSAYNSDPEDGFNEKSSVSLFSNSVLEFNPGSDYNYTSYGFNLLGATIEEASPNGYASWVKNKIRDVANMQTFQISKIGREGHRKSCDGILKKNISGDKEYVLPSGGYESTICDLAKYAIGLAQGDFFEEPNTLMWDVNNSTLFPGGTSRYGYGTYFDGTGDNLRVYHGGDSGNQRSYMHFFPSDSTGVVIMSSARYVNLPELTRHIYKAMGIRSNLYGFVRQTPIDNCQKGMNSCGDMFNGVWRKTNAQVDADVLIRTGLTHKEFYEEYKRLSAAGYYCKDFEAYVKNKELRWDGVFKKGAGKKAIWRNLKRADFIKKYKSMIADGYRILDLETYKLPNGQRRWAGLFEKSNGGYALYTNKTSVEFSEKRDEQKAKGNTLVDIEVFEENGTLLWSGIWKEGVENLYNVNLTPDQFEEMSKVRSTNGYRILDIEHYLAGDPTNFDWRITAIWEKSSEDELYEAFNDFCTMGKNQTTNSANRYELIDWERMEIDIIK